MKIRWFVEEGTGEALEQNHLLDTDSDLPREGDLVYFHTYTSLVSMPKTRMRVKRVNHSITASSYPFSQIPKSPNAAQISDEDDRLTDQIHFSEEYVQKQVGGHIVKIDTKNKQYIYTTHHAEVILTPA